MTAQRSTTRGATPPKGRPTPKRGEVDRARSDAARRAGRFQWAVLALVAVVVLVALFAWVGGGDGTGGVPIGGHTN